VSRARTLKSLEVVLESFLDRAVALKEDRLRVLSGINRLDDIAREVRGNVDHTDQIGGWFAEHNRWLDSQTLRPADRSRIGDILDHIKGELHLSESASPASRKIATEIDRWTNPSSPASEPGTPRLVLKRGAEQTQPEASDSVGLFRQTLDRMKLLFEDAAGNKAHLMSALDDALRSAYEQRSRDALLLSAYIIYYLKHNGYKVEPFVARLKRAEQLIRGGAHA
jgi:hypothetical protein